MARHPRRFSRGVPFVLTSSEQEAFLIQIAQDDELARDLETLFRVTDIRALTKQEQLALLRGAEDVGFGAGFLTAAFKAKKELHNLAAEQRGELAKDDRIVMLEAEVAEKDRRLTGYSDIIDRLAALTPEAVQQVQAEATSSGSEDNGNDNGNSDTATKGTT